MDDCNRGQAGRPGSGAVVRTSLEAFRERACSVQPSPRKIIVDEIQARIKSGLSPDAAVKEVEGKHSLYRLSQSLTNSRRGG